MIERALLADAWKVLFDYKKMAFISGPRQVGKTTVARGLLKKAQQGLYFDWDSAPDQRRLVTNPHFFEAADRAPKRPFLVVLDEIHKYGRWKNYLKGVYDTHKEEFRFLVTGSGRLDIFKKGGDSLLGRYLPLPLFPLTVGEAAGTTRSLAELMAAGWEPADVGPRSGEALSSIERFSGFPEPFLRQEEAFYGPWSRERRKLLVREDIRDASAVHDISLLEALSHLVAERTGSLLSVNALSKDVGVSFAAARSWLELLESFYLIFRIRPFAGSLARTLKREAKAYLYDPGEAAEGGVRFENVVALHLHKAAVHWRATGQGDTTLHFVRDKEKREADFLIADRGRPMLLVECKLSDASPAPALRYFQERLGVRTAVQLVHGPGVCRKFKTGAGALWVVSADRWLAGLP